MSRSLRVRLSRLVVPLRPTMVGAGSCGRNMADTLGRLSLGRGPGLHDVQRPVREQAERGSVFHPLLEARDGSRLSFFSNSFCLVLMVFVFLGRRRLRPGEARVDKAGRYGCCCVPNSTCMQKRKSGKQHTHPQGISREMLTVLLKPLHEADIELPSNLPRLAKEHGLGRTFLTGGNRFIDCVSELPEFGGNSFEEGDQLIVSGEILWIVRFPRLPFLSLLADHLCQTARRIPNTRRVLAKLLGKNHLSDRSGLPGRSRFEARQTLRGLTGLPDLPRSKGSCPMSRRRLCAGSRVPLPGRRHAPSNPRPVP
jgi:hypothetical protein